jgi:repressor LexA
MSKIRELRERLQLSQQRFAEQLNISPRTVQNWEKGATSPDLEAISKAFHVSVESIIDDDENITNYTYRTEIYASAGTGYINPDNEGNAQIVRIDNTIAHKIGIGNWIELIKVRGDSMSPKYSSGDMVFVDLHENIFNSEGIYAILYEGTLMIKYLQKIKGGIRIHALNNEYPNIDMTADDYKEADIAIVGRVKGAVTFE